MTQQSIKINDILRFSDHGFDENHLDRHSIKDTPLTAKECYNAIETACNIILSGQNILAQKYDKLSVNIHRIINGVAEKNKILAAYALTLTVRLTPEKLERFLDAEEHLGYSDVAQSMKYINAYIYNGVLASDENKNIPYQYVQNLLSPFTERLNFTRDSRYIDSVKLFIEGLLSTLAIKLFREGTNNKQPMQWVNDKARIQWVNKNLNSYTQYANRYLPMKGQFYQRHIDKEKGCLVCDFRDRKEGGSFYYIEDKKYLYRIDESQSAFQAKISEYIQLKNLPPGLFDDICEFGQSSGHTRELDRATRSSLDPYYQVYTYPNQLEQKKRKLYLDSIPGKKLKELINRKDNKLTRESLMDCTPVEFENLLYIAHHTDLADWISRTDNTLSLDYAMTLPSSGFERLKNIVREPALKNFCIQCTDKKLKIERLLSMSKEKFARFWVIVTHPTVMNFINLKNTVITSSADSVDNSHQITINNLLELDQEKFEDLFVSIASLQSKHWKYDTIVIYSLILSGLCLRLYGYIGKIKFFPCSHYPHLHRQKMMSLSILIAAVIIRLLTQALYEYCLVKINQSLEEIVYAAQDTELSSTTPSLN
jgi:hypothetical protein